MRKPDFFIVGAPKCGTTSLNEYLKDHPNVFIPEKKELHYFGSDLDIERPSFLLNDYLRYFSDAPSNSLVGEASVWYLYSEQAAQEIYEFNPNAKIIIMLRNPTEAIYSLHSQMLWGTNEDIEDFEEALEAENDRKQGLRLAKTTVFRKALLYREVYKYSEQIRRYLELFDRKKVHIIVFDDFKSDPSKAYSAVCDFLGVDKSFLPDFSIRNPNKHLGNRKLAAVMRRPPFLLSSFYRSIFPEQLRRRIRGKIKTSNTVYSKRKEISVDIQNRLRNEYTSEVNSVSKILNRDLSSWNI